MSNHGNSPVGLPGTWDLRLEEPLEVLPPRAPKQSRKSSCRVQETSISCQRGELYALGGAICFYLLSAGGGALSKINLQGKEFGNHKSDAN